MLYYQPGMQAVRTCDSVANVRDAVSLISVRENRRRDESLLLQATHWKLMEITLKIEFIVPPRADPRARDCLRLWNLLAGQRSLPRACALERMAFTKWTPWWNRRKEHKSSKNYTATDARCFIWRTMSSVRLSQLICSFVPCVHSR